MLARAQMTIRDEADVVIRSTAPASPAAVLATTFVLLMSTGSTVSVGLDGSVTFQLPVVLTAEAASVT